MTGQIDPRSPRSVRAAEMAREMLTARVMGDEKLWNETIVAAMHTIMEDPELLPHLIAAQTVLAWGAICQGIGCSLGPDMEDDEFDEDFETMLWERTRLLAQGMERRGWTIG